jgi:hypothetical protein
MTMSMQAALAAIGRQLDADYRPLPGTPLPRELEDLLARLIAYEIRKREPTERSEEGLQSLIRAKS